jgi:hypothetical protein
MNTTRSSQKFWEILKTLSLISLAILTVKNLKGAYSQAENPNWGSYETFSNPNSGFGTVKKLDVKVLIPNLMLTIPQV